MQAQLKTAQAGTRPNFLIELAKAPQKKIGFKKFPMLQKKYRTQSTANPTMTQKLNTDNGLQGRTTKIHWL